MASLQNEDAGRLRGLTADAQALAARLPALRLEAKRIAQTVAFGVHGRRRAGPGDSFWQFRQYETSDTRNLIDWRRSANSNRLFVRQREWEAAHTVWLWVDLSPSMDFASHLATVTKRERALVLMFAAAELLVQGGERVGLVGLMPPTARRDTTEKMAEALITDASANGSRAHTLAAATLSRQADCVLFGDFLDPIETIEPALRHLAGQGVRGHLVQVLDPAEETLAYSGRVEFRDPEGGRHWLAARAEQLRERYRGKLAEHRAAIDSVLRKLQWTRLLHHTDRPGGEALMTLHARLSGDAQAEAATRTMAAEAAR